MLPGPRAAVQDTWAPGLEKQREHERQRAKQRALGTRKDGQTCADTENPAALGTAQGSEQQRSPPVWMYGPRWPGPGAALCRGSPAHTHGGRDRQKFRVTEDEHPQVCHPPSWRPGQQLQVAVSVYDSNQESQEWSDHVLDSLPQGVPWGRETKKHRGTVSNNISKPGGGGPEKLLTFTREKVPVLPLRAKALPTKSPTLVTGGSPVIPLFHPKHSCTPALFGPSSCKAPTLRSQERQKCLWTDSSTDQRLTPQISKLHRTAASAQLPFALGSLQVTGYCCCAHLKVPASWRALRLEASRSTQFFG